MSMLRIGQKNDELSSKNVSVTTRSLEDTHRRNETRSADSFNANETQTKKQKPGRPPKQGAKLTESRIMFYVTKEMEDHLLEKFGDAPGMRRFLLNSSDYPGQIK